jgi:hypothetical protein
MEQDYLMLVGAVIPPIILASYAGYRFSQNRKQRRGELTWKRKFEDYEYKKSAPPPIFGKVIDVLPDRLKEGLLKIL